MDEVKGYLQTGIYNSYGVVATIFIDSVDNLGKMQEIVGMDKEALGKGSVAFDKMQNVCVYDGEHWVLDDGTELPNWVKNWVIPMQTVKTSFFVYYVQPQTFTPTKGDGNFYKAYLTCLTEPRWDDIWGNGDNDNVTVVFDGETYNCPLQGYDGNFWCVEEGKFTIAFPNGMWDDDKIAVDTPDSNQHTLAIIIYEEDHLFAVLNDVESPLPDTIAVVFSGKEYLVERNEDNGYGASWNYDLDGFDWSEYPFFVYNEEIETRIATETEGEYTIGAYVLEEEGGDDSGGDEGGGGDPK